MSDSSTLGTPNPDAGDQDQQSAGSIGMSPADAATGNGGDALGPAADGTDGSLGTDAPTGDAGLADGGLPGGVPIAAESTGPATPGNPATPGDPATQGGSATEGASADGRME